METIKLKIDQNGRLLLPTIFRKRLNLKVGQEVLIYQEGEELKIRSFKESAKKARALIKQYNTDNIDLLSLLSLDREQERKKNV